MSNLDERAVLAVGVAMAHTEQRGKIVVSFGATHYFLDFTDANTLFGLLGSALSSVSTEGFADDNGQSYAIEKHVSGY